MVKRRALYFTAPGQVEVREEPLPEPAPGQVLVETVFSAISPGTEMLVYRGQFPNIVVDKTIPALSGHFSYPLCYGYAAVGRVTALGKDVTGEWENRLVFSFQPHVSHFLAETSSLFPVPPDIHPETAAFLPNMETAVNLVQDGAPLLGENVLVFGQGIIGLMTVALLSQFPLHTLVTADCYPRRREASLALGVTACLDPLAAGFGERVCAVLPAGADLTFELSGAPTALNDAIAHTMFSGRVVIGSWYGEKNVSLDLGGEFHRSRIRLISSQVSSLAPELTGRWDKARRFAVAWEALGRIRPEKWITHRFPFETAAEAYHLLDQSPAETIQIIFEY
jgi:2-desacetyl-2-hydroxyethyl bacteriochlorophyllide A dehydrogenase